MSTHIISSNWEKQHLNEMVVLPGYDSSVMQIDNTLLSLLRLSFNHPTVIPDTINWSSILNQSSEQGVLALIWDAILKLYDNGQLIDGRELDVVLKKKWIAIIFQNYENKYIDYKRAIGELAAFYNRHGLKMMLLKGYGLGLNYPVPEHRPCGDIDIWTFGYYREADAVLSNELGIPIDASHHHHTVFRFQGYCVENHYDFVNIHTRKSNRDIEKIFKRLAESDDNYTIINGEKVYLPSPDLHALFLLRHTMMHFASTSMTLRQVLDWAFFVEKNSARIHWDWLQNVLNQFHMVDFFCCINAICVEDLGFSSSFFPNYSTPPVLKHRILEDTLHPEFQGTIPSRFLSRFFFKIRRWRANNWKQRICYNECLLWSFLTLAWSHLVGPNEK